MKKFKYDDAIKKSTNYFNGDKLAAEVFVNKYALRDLDNNIYELTPDDMHKRLAKEFARIENKYKNPLSEEEIYKLFSSWKIVPQGSPMSAIGNPYQIQSLSNCFVLPNCYDSYSSIIKTDQMQCNIMKRRGGVGHDLSNLRPHGAITNNAARTSDGIGVFMERFSNATREVAQSGRRGALMLTVAVEHPDIETFINIKKDKTKVTGANISIRASDAFMKAVKNDEDFVLRWPVTESPENAKITKTVRAKDIWNQIIESAHASADPGVLFWDTILRESVADIYDEFKSISTNPCSEIVLEGYGACRLLLINVTKYVNNKFLNNALFDFDSFKEDARKAQRLMDDLVDLEIEAIDKIIEKIKSDPEPDDIKNDEITLWENIKKSGIRSRRTGLGITGLGDALAMINVKYGSKESIEITEEIYKSLAVSAHKESVLMAVERGAFPACEPDLYKNTHPFFDRLKKVSEPKIWELFLKHGRRNIALTTTAPAGSVSMLTQTTSGIEPAFLLSYKRRKKINPNDNDSKVDFIDELGDKWQEFTVYHHGFKQWLDITGNEDVEKSPYYKATSNDIDWGASVEILSKAQKWVEHSISKTINLPSDSSRELVSELYMKAWERGCKGITIYRDGCKSGVLVSNTEESKTNQPNEIIETHAPKRPNKLPCDIHRVTVKGESYLVLVGLLNNKPYEIFCGLQEYVEIPKKIKKGFLIKNNKVNEFSPYNLIIPLEDDKLIFKDIIKLFDNPIYGAFTRTLSLSLRHGIPVQYIVEQLRKDKHSDITSFSTVIARVLSKNYIPDGTKANSAEKKCTQCESSNLSYQQGCVTCLNCGNSKCG